ncbi:hypothetical protein UFOVP24_30 [uncultured Caudovirales phage]|jgi:hypothetical protein|uniref:Uncharacterized protein n=1 Tax=uncultured Caudovirales phage TaxID=2100421 RepID=A0A6J5T8J0_9CAUD|nr:hypothetical protein UFOVP24_30 [uncultured Caudovirales phage]
MSYLATVSHDTQSNTLEATWLELVGEELKRTKCRSYSADQKDEFLSDCGDDGLKYITLAGW